MGHIDIRVLEHDFLPAERRMRLDERDAVAAAVGQRPHERAVRARAEHAKRFIRLFQQCRPTRRERLKPFLGWALRFARLFPAPEAAVALGDRSHGIARIARDQRLLARVEVDAVEIE